MDYSFINKLILFILMVLVIFQWIGPVKTAGKALTPVLRWTMIAIAAICLLQLFYHMPKIPGSERINSPYAWAYVLMILGNTLFPFILLFKRAGNNIYLLLLIAIMMNIGWLFECIIMGMRYFL